MYRNLQRHRAVIPATARLLFLFSVYSVNCIKEYDDDDELMMMMMTMMTMMMTMICLLSVVAVTLANKDII